MRAGEQVEREDAVLSSEEVRDLAGVYREGLLDDCVP